MRAIDKKTGAITVAKGQEIGPHENTVRIIHKKILPVYFEDVARGIKNFELRKDEDDVQPEDILVLEEYIVGKYPPFSCKYTGRKITKTVRYVLRDATEYGLMKGYCIIGF